MSLLSTFDRWRQVIFPYYFGLYHWRERLRRLALALVVGFVAGVLARAGSRRHRLVAAGAGLWAATTGRDALAKLFQPPPWVVEQYKYEALADRLPVDDTDRLIDVGCGTGRSLVGLSAAIPERCQVVGLDVFDERIILGNGPLLARQNAARAGLDCAIVRGDAARLPIADSTHDIGTACRVLHDLPAEDAIRTLAEMHRVCTDDGVVGVLELPYTHGETSVDPASYWRTLVTNAGFTVETVDRIPRRGNPGDYVVVVGRRGTGQ